MISQNEMNRQACELYLHESLGLCQDLEEGLLLLGNDPGLAQLPRLLRSIDIITVGAEQFDFAELCQLTDALKAILRGLEAVTKEGKFQYRESFLRLLQPISEQLRFTLLLSGYRWFSEATVQDEQRDLIQQFLFPKSFLVLQEALLLPNLPLCRLLWKKQLLLLRSWSFLMNSTDIATIAETALKTIDTFPDGILAVGELAIIALQILARGASQTPAGIEVGRDGNNLEQGLEARELPSQHFSTSDSLVCVVDGYFCSIASHSIAEIIVPQPDQLIQVGADAYLAWENQTLSLYNASELILTRQFAASEYHGPVLILKQDRHFLALALNIEHLISDTTLPLEAAPADAPEEVAIIGWTRFNDTLTPILDVNRWLQQYTERSLSNPLNPDAQTLSVPSSPLILVVDDSRAIREQICSTLQGSGYRTLQAQGGQEALSCLREHPEIGLVLSDLEMGNLSGFEFLRKRMQYAEFRHIPVIILSSHISAEYRQLAQKLGAVGYLTIPYEPQSLLSTVGAILQG
jgi:CheY-like chemotaxis protein